MTKKRKSLGKGLDALLGDKARPTGVNNSPLQQLAIADIQPSRNQPRKHFDTESLEKLALSIRSQGVIQPIIVTGQGNSYQLIAGERRWRAAQLAKLKTVPAIIRESDELESQLIGLLENIQRQDLNAIEIAESIQALTTTHNLTHESIAKALGMSRPSVSNLLRLSELHPSIKKMLIAGKIEMGHARAVLAVDEKHRLAFAQHIANTMLNVRQTESLAKKWPPGPGKSPVPAKDKDVERFVRECSEKLGMKVDIQHKPNGTGRFIVHYHSIEQLHRLTDNVVMQKGHKKPQ